MTYGQFADVYDRLMDDVDYDAWYAEIKALLRPTGIGPPARACDAACGTGQFAVRLAADGYEVTGVDISDDMLRVASKNAREKGVAVQFARQDIRKLSLPRPVPLVVCACDGVNYLASPQDVQAFFVAAKNALAPGGALVFDVSTEDKLRNSLGNNAMWDLRDDVAYIWQNRWNESSRQVTMELTFFSREQDGRYRRFEERHVQRAHSHDELCAWLAKAGLRVEGSLRSSFRAHYMCRRD